LRQAGAQSSESTQIPSGLMLGTGVRTVATQKIFTPGSTQNTGNPLDVAIRGQGFFQVLLPDGSEAYTRDGTFNRDSSGQMVTSNGYVLQPVITIPEQTTSITIGEDGTVSIVVAGDSTPTNVGTIQLTNFINPTGLQPMGQNLFVETVASGAPQTDNPGASGLGILQQGALEASNVNVVEELVNMIQAQRAYEMNAKSIETVDSMMQYVSQTL